MVKWTEVRSPKHLRSSRSSILIASRWDSLLFGSFSFFFLSLVQYTGYTISSAFFFPSLSSLYIYILVDVERFDDTFRSFVYRIVSACYLRSFFVRAFLSQPRKKVLPWARESWGKRRFYTCPRTFGYNTIFLSPSLLFRILPSYTFLLHAIPPFILDLQANLWISFHFVSSVLSKSHFFFSQIHKISIYRYVCP